RTVITLQQQAPRQMLPQRGQQLFAQPVSRRVNYLETIEQPAAAPSEPSYGCQASAPCCGHEPSCCASPCCGHEPSCCASPCCASPCCESSCCSSPSCGGCASLFGDHCGCAQHGGCCHDCCGGCQTSCRCHQ